MNSRYTIISNDNVYFHDSTDSIGFAALYDGIFAKADGTLIHLPFYTNNDGDEQHAKYIRSLSSSEMETLLEKIRRLTNLKTLNFCYAMGRTLLTINISEIYQVHRAIQTILEEGFRIYLNDHSQLTINLEDVNGQYNQTNRELALQKKYKKLVQQGDKYWDSIKRTISYQWRCAGRVILPELKEWMISQFPEENNENNMWTDLKWETSDPVESDKLTNDSNESSDDELCGLCIVCFENERETYLEPCGHIVVCEACSDKLATSDNDNLRRLCVYCQQNIETISYIKRSKIVHLE